MEIGEDVCYRALATRDARFDGRFFTAVLTTGVYCRPVCPAKTPRRQNCRFYGSAAAAAEAGFRPCLRCRPESSPGTPAWAGTSATVTRALRLIGEGALVDASVDQLASRLGMGSRQLRRLFLEHLGAPPAAVEQTRRAHFAKKLLDETDLPVTQIAFSAGFNSVRRFNSAMQKAYRRSPRELRKREGRHVGDAVIRLRLGYRPPFDWGQITDFLRLRAIPGVELVSERSYARSIAVGDYRGVLQVSPGEGDWLVLEVASAAAADLPRIVAGVRAIFDLGADPHKIADQLASDGLLRPVVRARPGLRVPGAWDAFELAVRAVLGQQVSVKGATTLAGRIARRYGERIETDVAGIDRLFPSPAGLTGLVRERAGIPVKRVETIRALAETASGDGTLFDCFGEVLSERLCRIPGMGPWTASYVAMRALGEPDAFPASDLGLRRGFAALSGDDLPSAAGLEHHSERWRPWRAYAAMHLWSASR